MIKLEEEVGMVEYNGEGDLPDLVIDLAEAGVKRRKKGITDMRPKITLRGKDSPFSFHVLWENIQVAQVEKYYTCIVCNGKCGLAVTDISEDELIEMVKSNNFENHFPRRKASKVVDCFEVLDFTHF